MLLVTTLKCLLIERNRTQYLMLFNLSLSGHSRDDIESSLQEASVVAPPTRGMDQT